MKHLNVEFFKGCNSKTAITEVSFLLDKEDKNKLNQVPWAEYNYLPCVHFAIAYGSDCIFLKYYVKEKYLRAENVAPNTAVYQDTCVEFFIRFENQKAYYNFEFNCIGTMLIGFGESKADRELLDGQLISQIKYQSVINNDHPDSDQYWELTVAIPFTLFGYTNMFFINGKKCRANFYKCGDNLPTPHFITWSNISSPEPNFHLPEFFGTLHFQ